MEKRSGFEARKVTSLVSLASRFHMHTFLNIIKLFFYLTKSAFFTVALVAPIAPRGFSWTMGPPECLPCKFSLTTSELIAFDCSGKSVYFTVSLSLLSILPALFVLSLIYRKSMFEFY